MTISYDIYDPVISIGTVAKRLGVAVQTVRLYEKEGLVLPYKTQTGRRLFSAHDVERLKCIRKMITEHGLNISGIKQLMALIPCWDYRGGFDDDCRICKVFSESIGPCWNVREVGAKCRHEDCRLCSVYRLEISCDRMKEIIHGERRKELLNNSIEPLRGEEETDK